jgi:hypothetical protein
VDLDLGVVIIDDWKKKYVDEVLES